MKKHLVYAEDLQYELMQYPRSTMPKAEIHACVERVINTKSVTIWQHLWNKIRELFGIKTD